MTIGVWGLDMFIAKNILNFIAEGCRAAAQRYDFKEFRWVTSFFEECVPEEGVQLNGSDGFIAALGPNPAVLCNLAAGVEQETRAQLKRCRQSTLRSFQEIVKRASEMMPHHISFRTSRG